MNLASRIISALRRKPAETRAPNMRDDAEYQATFAAEADALRRGCTRDVNRARRKRAALVFQAIKRAAERDRAVQASVEMVRAYD